MELREAEESMRASGGDDAALLRDARRVLSCRRQVEEVASQAHGNVKCYEWHTGPGGT